MEEMKNNRRQIYRRENREAMHAAHTAHTSKRPKKEYLIEKFNKGVLSGEEPREIERERGREEDCAVQGTKEKRVIYSGHFHTLSPYPRRWFFSLSFRRSARGLTLACNLDNALPQGTRQAPVTRRDVRSFSRYTTLYDSQTSNPGQLRYLGLNSQ